ncbi:ketoacyl-synt-domain-containing protein [Aspergillus ambiguus]|uniref:type I polyketide synthase n=1 Tax=Aspergillus ambiguus TaxID=176160 RepID=UPI003CCE4223
MPSAVESFENSSLEPIAIVGMACRLPGSVNSPSRLWELLCKNQSVRTPRVPGSRFNIDAHYHPDLGRPGSFNSLGGYFLDGSLEDFDPTFFNMTPVEAMWLDPQQRKMLEVSYECLENAGLTLDDVSGTNTAVFVGCFTSDYQQMSTSDPDFRHNYCATGVDVGVMSNRIGNTFNLNGPSFTINTACSSSVYAIHNACNALRAGDCVAAITGGVNLILTVDQHINTAKLGVLSDTSTCHTFDESADGYGRAEGAGALYLKRLSDAIRDGNVIRSVIRSSAVNTNGKVEGMGITFPSVTGQERAIRAAYKRASLDPNRTAYFECHGTGTPVGDPIEVRAVSNAMNDTRSRENPLLLGAVKTNIGHSEAASGIFAVMKAAMATETGLIPAVHGFKTLNPEIKDKEWNVKITTDLTPWPEDFDIRRASVSSFGYGGTNGHVIVESIDSVCPWYEHAKPKEISDYRYEVSRPFLIGMSAHDKQTLTRNIKAHQNVVDRYHLPDLAYTLNTRRTRFAHRGYTVISEGQERASFAVESFKFGVTSKPGEIAFVFTGQGAQWARMGYEAIRTFPLFRQTIDDLDRVLHSVVDPKPSWTLSTILEANKELSRVNEAEISQPVCTAVQIAIVDLFASWGIKPTVTLGHSSGEIGAAYAAGRLSAPEAILAAFFRGFAVKEAAPAGTMLAVGLGAVDAEQYIPEAVGRDVTIACENSPSSVTLSGTAAGIAVVKAELDAAGIFARELRTGKAYHSSQMDAVAPRYQTLFSKAARLITKHNLSWRRPKAAMISSVTGIQYTVDDVPISYLCDNLRSRVLFDSALATLGNSERFSAVNLLIEIGPHSALGGPIKQTCAVKGFSHLGYIPSLVRGVDSAISLLKTAGEVFNKGFVDIDFKVINQVDRSGLHRSPKKHDTPLYIPDLPPYQWNYENTFWYEPRPAQERRQHKYERHDILGRRLFGLSKNAAAWKNILRQRDVPWLKDHTLGDAVVFPGAGHLSLAIEAYLQLLEKDETNLAGVEIKDVDIGKALVVPDNDDGIEIQTRLHRSAKDEGNNIFYTFVVESIENGNWTIHSEGKIRGILIDDDHRPATHQFEAPLSLDNLHQRTQGKRFYDAFHRVGFKYGPSFHTLQSVRANGKERVTAANINVQTDSGLMAQESRYLLHPSTIDGCLHLVIASIHRGVHKNMPWAVVPLEIDQISLFFPGTDNALEGSAMAWTDRHWNGRYFNHGTQLRGASGKLLMNMRNIKSVKYDAIISGLAPPRQAYSQVSWKPYVTDISSSESSSAHSDEVLINGPIAIISGQGSDPRSLRAELDPVSASLVFDIEDGNLASGIANTENIIVDDRAGAILSQASEQAFDNIKLILCSKKSVVWVTRGVNQGNSVGGGMAQGFLRAVRSEVIEARIALLDVDEGAANFQIASTILERLANNATKDSGRDVEFWLRPDQLNVPRIVPNDELNDLFFKNAKSVISPVIPGKRFSGNIVDSELVFDVSDINERLGPNEAEIQVQFAEFSTEDLMPYQDRWHIVIGTVRRVGQELDHSVVGREVVAYSRKPFETIVKSNAFVKTNGQINAAVVASTLPILCKAIDAVLDTGNSKPGDRVLLLSATQPFINAVTKLGRLAGLEVTVSDDISDVQKLLSSTKSPNLVVGCSSSMLAQEVWRCMPSGSKFVLTDASVDWPLDPKPFTRGVSFLTRGTRCLAESGPLRAVNVLERAMELMVLNRGFSQAPTIVDVEILQDVSSLSNKKVVLEHGVLRFSYSRSNVISKEPRKQVSFSPSSAYLLVGCLGGLGRSLTRWMFEKGCKNFVFLSRSGTDKPEAAEVVRHLETDGATVQVFRVDAGNEKAVVEVVSKVQATIPIRGVVHAAMVLQDGMFEGLTYDNYITSVNPKMNGAMSLHKALSDTALDFFVMTSSISAVLGNPGQANYCAGNSYLDALAWYRQKQSMAASSIALPMVYDVGVVAENSDIEVSLSRKGLYGIDEREMLQAFEAGMLQGPVPPNEEAQIGDAQILLGLEAVSLAAAMTSAETTDAYWANDSRLAEIRSRVDTLTSHNKPGQKQGGFLETVAGRSPEEAVEAVAQHIMAQCAKILLLPVEKFEMRGSSIASYGVDSMIGVELRTWLYKELGLEVGFQALLGGTMDFERLAQLALAE